MTRYGYARVSSGDQNLSRQITALKNEGISEKNLYLDKTSGKDFMRPGYKKLLEQIQKDDVIVVLSLDRFGRNYDEIQAQWKYITHVKKADIVVLDMPLLNTEKTQENLTKTFISHLVLSVISYVAQLEREKIHERQRQGIREARIRGVRFGRPTKKPVDWKNLAQQIHDGLLTKTQAAHLLGVHCSTVCRWIKQGDND